MIRPLENYIIQVPNTTIIGTDLTRRELARHLMSIGGVRFDPKYENYLWVWTGPLVKNRVPQYRRRVVYPYLYHTYKYPEIPLRILETRAIFRPYLHPLDVNPHNYRLKPRQCDVTGLVKASPTTFTQDEQDLADMLINYADDVEMLATLETTYTSAELDKARLINKLKGT